MAGGALPLIQSRKYNFKQAHCIVMAQNKLYSLDRVAGEPSATKYVMLSGKENVTLSSSILSDRHGRGDFPREARTGPGICLGSSALLSFALTLDTLRVYISVKRHRYIGETSKRKHDHLSRCSRAKMKLCASVFHVS